MKIETKTDEELYKEWKQGRSTALQELFERYSAKLEIYAKNILKNEELAQDAIQNTFLYILNYPDEYKESYSLKSYIYLVTRTTCFNMIRKQKRRDKIDEKYNVNEEELYYQDGLETIIHNEEKQALLEEIKKLKKEYKEVIYLVDIEGFSYKDIAKIMNKTEGQIKVLIHRARNKLKNNIHKKVMNISQLSIILLISIIFSSVIYASIYIVQKILKEPEKYNLDELKEAKDKINIQQSDEKAKNILNEFCKKMGYKCEISEEYEYKSIKENKNYFVIKSDYFESIIDLEKQHIVQFINKNVDYCNNLVEKSKMIEMATCIKNKINEDTRYKLTNIETSIYNDIQVCICDFNIIYEGIINPYQCIRIIFVPENGELVKFKYFDYEFENNEIILGAEEAKDIIESFYKNFNQAIYDITLNIDIVEANYNLYYELNEDNEKREFYSYSGITRKVWNAKVILVKNNKKITEHIYVDCTTGEIIGKN